MCADMGDRTVTGLLVAVRSIAFGVRMADPGEVDRAGQQHRDERKGNTALKSKPSHGRHAQEKLGTLAVNVHDSQRTRLLRFQAAGEQKPVNFDGRLPGLLQRV